VFRSGDSLIVELKDLSLLATFQKWHALNQTARTDSPSTPPADANPETMASKDKPGNVEKSPSVPKALKGRSNKKVDLPGNDTLEEWQKKAKDQGSVGTHCYSIIEEYVSQYNTYKWRNYDKLISNKNELKQVVQLASSHVGHTVNSINSHLKRLKEIAVERKSMRVREDFVLGEIAELEEKLQGWQFFGSEKRTRNKITSLKRDIENLHNSLDSLNKNEENIKRLLGKFSDIGNLEEFGSTARTYLKEILSDKAIAESWKEASNDKQLSKQQMQGIYNKANKNRKS